MYNDGYAGIFESMGVSVMPSPKSGRRSTIGAPFAGEPVRSTERLKELHEQGDIEYMYMEGKLRYKTGHCARTNEHAFAKLALFTDEKMLVMVRLKPHK